MKRARIDHLHAVAKDRRPGYLEACMKAGRVSPDSRWITFLDEDHACLRRRFNPLAASSGGAGAAPPATRGLGDLVHKVAGPIGRAIGWPCLKGDGTTDLKPGSPCESARRTLNKIEINFARHRKKLG
jgi:hypothetical protein